MSDEWLEHLEKTVHDAAETITTLREEKQGLASRIEELEDEVERLEAEGGGDAGDGATEAWQEERSEIRRRVESLTEKLEGLLDGNA